MTAVWSLALCDSEKLVLLALADCANDEGHCWPSMRTLAAKCSKSDRTVQAAIKALEAAGHLTRREVPGKGCNYTVHPRSDCTPEAASPRRGFATPPKPVRDTPEAASDKPSKNHKEPSSGTRKRARSADDEIPDFVPRGPWEAFEAMRTKKKKPTTPYIRKQLWGRLRSIQEAGWNLEDVINKATINFNDGFWMPDGRDPNVRRATVTKAGAADPLALAATLEKRADWYDSIDRAGDAAEAREKAARLRRGHGGPPKAIGDLIPKHLQHHGQA